MSRFIVPLEKPKPDVERWVKVIKGEEIPERPPMVEYIIDDAVMKPILIQMMGYKWVARPKKEEYMGGQMDFSRVSKELARRYLLAKF